MFVFVIKEIMQEKGITTEELSKQTKLSIQYIESLIENKIHNTSLDKIYKIAYFLEVPIQNLFYSTYDYNSIRSKLHESILKNGLDAEETKRLSYALDNLLNLMN